MMKYGMIKNYVNGQFQDIDYSSVIDVYSPKDGQVIAQLGISNKEILHKSVELVQDAAKQWAQTSTLKQRCEIVLTYRQLLKESAQELAQVLSLENGKLEHEAMAEIFKSIELLEFTASLAQQNLNRTQQVSRGVFCTEEREPLGVVASITPFNFPCMVPHWTIATAIALGNSVFLKPSEFTPITASYLGGLWEKAGLPPGIFNVINGGKELVQSICDHSHIKSVSFVGSTPVAKIVYQRASLALKKVLALGGAKNYIILLEDAHPKMAVNDIIAAFLGMSGQRCMAASVLVGVGDVRPIIENLVEKVKALKSGKDFPPLITSVAVRAMQAYLQNAREQGAKVLVSGSEFSSPNLEGYYFGPSVVEWDVSRFKEALNSQQEIFGPTLDIVCVDSLSEAIALQNTSPYGNAVSVFTQNGRLADETIPRLEAGMKGINIGVPVPRDPFSFGGLKGSKFGVGDITGIESLSLWSNLIKVTKKWNPQDKKDWMS